MLVRFAFLVVVVFTAAAAVVVVVIFVQSSLALVLVFLFSVVLVCAAHCPLTAPRCHFSDFFFSLSGALIIRRLFSTYSIIHSLFASLPPIFRLPHSSALLLHTILLAG